MNFLKRLLFLPAIISITFSTPLFKIKRSGYYGFADIEGNIIIQPQWDDASSFKDGLATVKRADKGVYQRQRPSYHSTSMGLC